MKFNKGGRPIIEEGEKKIFQVKSLLKKNQYQSVTKYCMERDIKISDLVRESVLEKIGIETKRKIHSDVVKTITELNKIGSNLNQLARKANQNTYTKSDSLTLKSYLKKLDRWSEIIKNLNNDS